MFSNIRLLATAAALATVPLAATTAQAIPAQATTTARAAAAQAARLPVSYDFLAQAALTANEPSTPPPGANDWNCKPSAAHPRPVVLVHGTFANMDDDWQTASPILANHGYCVFAFNFGGATATSDVQGTGDIAASAQTLAAFVDKVLTATGAAKVDLVGHSQGGMMPRYYIDFLGGAATVDKLVGLAPSNYGTTLDGFITLADLLGVRGVIDSGDTGCAACTEQEQGSSFLAGLNARPTVPGVSYTVIETRDDEVVTPYANAFLPAAPNVTSITLQDQCPLDQSDHLEIASDPVAMADMLNALDPASPVAVPCVPVLPLTGPPGPVPTF